MSRPIPPEIAAAAPRIVELLEAFERKVESLDPAIRDSQVAALLNDHMTELTAVAMQMEAELRDLRRRARAVVRDFKLSNLGRTHGLSSAIKQLELAVERK
jgi:ribosomal protein L16 Arg81 hydroxylase